MMILNNPPKKLICRVPLIFFIFNNQIPGFFEFFLIKNNKTGGCFHKKMVLIGRPALFLSFIFKIKIVYGNIPYYDRGIGFVSCKIYLCKHENRFVRLHIRRIYFLATSKMLFFGVKTTFKL